MKICRPTRSNILSAHGPQNQKPHFSGRITLFGEESMTIALIVLACVIVAGYGFTLYNTKVLAPAFEAERKEIMKLVREALPGVKIHELNPRSQTWLTYMGTEYFIGVPNYKSDEDGGPNTSVFKVGPDRRITSIWQHFHADSKDVNAQYFCEALKVIKAETPNQTITAQRVSRVADR